MLQKRLALVLTLVVLTVFLSAPFFGGSAVSAQDNSAAYQAILDEAVAKGPPGIAMYVRDGEGTEWVGVSGVSNRDTGKLLTADDHFVIYSITKTFTAVIILQLAEEGLLSVDDTIGQWLPDELVSPIPYASQITIRTLLEHTSGIDQADPLSEVVTNPDPARKYTPEQLVLDYTLQRGENGGPFAEPGGDVAYYSNTNYTLSALIAEAVTGQSYAELIRERIAQPLGMEDTFAWDYEEGVPVDIITGYTLLDGELLDLFVDLSFAFGAGNIISTAKDVGVFTSALFAGDLFQNPDTLPLMLREFHPLQDTGLDYSMGIMRYTPLPFEAYGHLGDSVGFTSVNGYFPDTGAVIVILTNFFDVAGDFEPVEVFIQVAQLITDEK